MKILILTNKLPYPPKDGGSIASLNMLTGLRDSGNQMTCLSINTSKHSFPIDKIPHSLAETIRFIGIDCDSSIKPVRLILNLILSREPYIAQRFNFSKFRNQLSTLLQQETFDLIQLEGPYTGYYLNEIRKFSKAPVALRAHNVEHLIWGKKAFNERSPLKHWYLKNMASRLKRFELKILNQSDYLISISPTDETYFRDQGFTGPTLTVPTGFSISDYPPTPLPAESTIFFIGALDWLPNQEGLLWFLDKVYDELLKTVPQLTFHVAGRNAPDTFIEKLQRPGLIYHGEVEDSRKFMQSYRVMVVPLLTGSGIRIKILEGMALGRPVVTTQVGIEGIPADNNKHAFVSDDPQQFANQIATLINSDKDASSMVAESRELIIRKFDTFELSNRLSQFFKAQV